MQITTFSLLPFAAISLMSHAAPVDFQRTIQPLFAEHCLECHGTDTAKGGLALTSLKAATKTLESGAQGIVPGKPESSELLARITTEHGDDVMPPLKKSKRLTQADIQAIRTWIAEGAEWAQHWAYRPITRPATSESALPNQLDEIIHARLSKENITPSPVADRLTLLKRVSYDLTGLPPTREDVATFLNDSSPNAFAALVDRTLASPHFGERWGRHWLDQARYADSDGYEKDSPRPDAWRYRDWVIDAINRDMPMDQFTIEQLAGDLLPNPTPDQLLATAFHRQTLTNREGGVDQEQFRNEAVFDRTETTGTVWLAHTVGCARCHSHKYDQLSQKEYYQLFAFFNNADETTAKIAASKAEMDAYASKNAEHLRQLATLRDQFQQIRAPLTQKLPEWERSTKERLATLEGKIAKIAPLTPSSADTASKTKLEIQPDQSLRAMGETAPTDSYTLTFNLPEGIVSGLRLEVLPDPSLPGKGPGRSPKGNYVLSRFAVASEGNDLPLHSAKASFEQSGFSAAAVLDDEPETGWAIMGGTAKSQVLTVQLVRPITADATRNLTVRLDQLSTKSKQHLIGRFRVDALVGESEESVAPPEMRRLVATGSEKWTNEQRESLVDWLVRLDTNADRLHAAILKAEAAGPKEPVMEVRILRQRNTAPRDTRILHRGEFLSPTDSVSPGTPSILPTLPGAPKDSTRLDLAKWLVSNDNPLTARVLANQIWMRLFGEGIVRTVADFGVRGEAPSHPELLDLLAHTLRTTGWSRKQLIKNIMLSETYRRSSASRPDLAEKDPLNTLLARQNRVRVEGEIVRDLHLAAAGLISRKIGGPSVYPPMPPEVAALSYANNFKWLESKGEDRYRRGMYTFFKRTAPYPDLMTFDCPDANLTNVRRTVSNTPLQALTTLNAGTFAEAALALGKRVATIEPPAGGDPERLAEIFRSVLIRNPRAAELESLTRLLNDARSTFRADPDAAKKLAGSPETAAWTTIARTLLNTDEFITRD
jgi:mono/diheme cytochrome c family protein